MSQVRGFRVRVRGGLGLQEDGGGGEGRAGGGGGGGGGVIVVVVVAVAGSSCTSVPLRHFIHQSCQ